MPQLRTKPGSASFGAMTRKPLRQRPSSERNSPPLAAVLIFFVLVNEERFGRRLFGGSAKVDEPQDREREHRCESPQQIVPRADCNAERARHPHACPRREAAHVRTPLNDRAGRKKRYA